MAELIGEHCVSCRRDAPSFTKEEILNLSLIIPNWNLIEEDQIPKLDRSFKFQGFTQALSFTNAVGEIAEEQGHHPRIVTEWGKVRVTWWTHKNRNLHRNAFIMAKKTDYIYQNVLR